MNYIKINKKSSNKVVSSQFLFPKEGKKTLKEVYEARLHGQHPSGPIVNMAKALGKQSLKKSLPPLPPSKNIGNLL